MQVGSLLESACEEAHLKFIHDHGSHDNRSIFGIFQEHELVKNSQLREPKEEIKEVRLNIAEHDVEQEHLQEAKIEPEYQSKSAPE